MNKSNLGAPYTHRVTVRLTDEQYAFLAEMCSYIDATPSDYIRMSVNSAMFTFRESQTKAAHEAVAEVGERVAKAAKKASSDNTSKNVPRGTKTATTASKKTSARRASSDKGGGASAKQ